jgi:hypothetical protein
MLVTDAVATSLEPPRQRHLRIAQMNVSLRPLEDRDLDTIFSK